jgi:hypothetical protein
MIDAWLKLEAELREMARYMDLGPQRRHERFLKDLDTRAEIIKQQVIHEIRAKFAEAFPNRWYAFLVQRPRDLAGGIPPWPLMFRIRERAEQYEDRVSPVVEVRL